VKTHGLDGIGRWLAAAALAACAGCARIRVEPVQVDVKPIHVTVDVNIKVQKVDRALEDFFGDVYGTATNTAPAEPSNKEKP